MELIGSIFVIFIENSPEDIRAMIKVIPNITSKDKGLNVNTDDELSIFEIVYMLKNVKINSSMDDRVNDRKDEIKL